MPTSSQDQPAQSNSDATRLKEVIMTLQSSKETPVQPEFHPEVVAFLCACQESTITLLEFQEAQRNFASAEFFFASKSRELPYAVQFLCRHNHLEQLQVLVTEYGDLTRLGMTGKALELACQYGHLELLQWLTSAAPKLLQSNVFLSLDPALATAPERLAAENGQLRILEWLATVPAFGKELLSRRNGQILADALRGGREDVFKWLIEDAKKYSGVAVKRSALETTGLVSAVRSGSIALVQYVLTEAWKQSDEKEELDLSVATAETMLQAAAQNRDLPMLHYLFTDGWQHFGDFTDARARLQISEDLLETALVHEDSLFIRELFKLHHQAVRSPKARSIESTKDQTVIKAAAIAVMSGNLEVLRFLMEESQQYYHSGTVPSLSDRKNFILKVVDSAAKEQDNTATILDYLLFATNQLPAILRQPNAETFFSQADFLELKQLLLFLDAAEIPDEEKTEFLNSVGCRKLAQTGLMQMTLRGMLTQMLTGERAAQPAQKFKVF